MWWIEEDILAGSHNPSEQELREAEKLGFTTLISLLDETEQMPAYSLETIPMKRLRYRYSIPVRDYAAPTIQQLRKFIHLVHSSPGNVLVHCQGGSGRTGTFGVAWLISRGIPFDEALHIIREANPDAVETAAQEECLRVFNDFKDDTVFGGSSRSNLMITADGIGGKFIEKRKALNSSEA